MEVTRTKLADGVYLTYLPARKFKTSLLSAQFVTPITKETAAAYALLPAVLRRGTVTYPDMGAMATHLDQLYGARIDYTIRKKGEKFYLDLKAINALALCRRGVDPGNIEISDACTACEPERFWSHRRVGNDRGSLAAIIVCEGGKRT